MSSIDPTDYASYLNQNRMNTVNGLLGNTNDTKIAGMPASLLEQWNSLGANSKALKQLQEIEKNGGVRPNQNQNIELMSDKFFNDHYDASTGEVKKATYTKDPTITPTVDSKATAGENLDSMRRLALAAIGKPNSLTDFHYDMFSQLQESIANKLVTTGSGSTSKVTGEAEAAKVSKNVGDFRLITDDTSFSVAGKKGEKTYSFSNGTSLESIVSVINADTAETSVKAELTTNEDGTFSMSFLSAEKGKDQTVKVTQKTGNLFGESGSVMSANGKDATKTEAETVDSSASSTAAIAAGVYSGKIMQNQAFNLSGSRGAKDYSFESGATAEEIAAAINADTEATGVKAEVLYNNLGEAEGIGLLADKAGSNHFVRVNQTQGDLFATAGKTVKVSGATGSSDSSGPGITSLNDLGKVTVDGQTYSFADLGYGGSATLAKNPDAALAVIDQALRDIYEGRAVIKGFDPAENPMINMPTSSNSTASNSMEVNNFGSSAMTDWLDKWTKDVS